MVAKALLLGNVHYLSTTSANLDGGQDTPRGRSSQLLLLLLQLLLLTLTVLLYLLTQLMGRGLLLIPPTTSRSHNSHPSPRAPSPPTLTSSSLRIHWTSPNCHFLLLLILPFRPLFFIPHVCHIRQEEVCSFSSSSSACVYKPLFPQYLAPISPFFLLLFSNQ